ncbi:hypothetical protein J27TS7_32080 [Paenibacillus dendritiformis]|uniref:DUF4176 domain-containing protein n=1 Tax=Paenibacillus dendritiformis TaxID=130049 RepID=UPI00143D49C5|nr:DUF4176 domain-containing protein [Paenibacillus dendritiformis]MBG9795923.1 hypothetical protein [Paenibacillus dendritiformis]NKI23180.1 DUF4176 domain-containing protein [Paenibacillus dendritiformis]NRF97422.1 DUF4176 domain-containing protein [Paenibacillus dendritiformis]GIO73694.1 hypothetical protein J27TS7_32080 [Paenibacillus dendritiformis]
MEKLLPIGSVVRLRNGEKRIMIYGRYQKKVNSELVFDYIACLYPEGNMNPNQAFLFDHDLIEEIYFRGFQDIEELSYNQMLQDYRERVDDSN